MAHCIIAGGAESFLSDGRYKPTRIMLLQSRKRRLLLGNGFNEAVAQQFKVSREDQDEFAHSQMSIESAS
jgi:acetyl-CoA acyltransferase